MNLGATFTNVPGGTATWTFTDATGNYNNASGTAAIVIDKANATVVVDGYTGAYNGVAHGATGSATGVQHEALAGLNLGASFTNVPGGTANWTFTDATGNYTNASGTAAIVIDKADATIVVDGFTGVYNGVAHGATGSATGVQHEALSGLNLGATFTTCLAVRRPGRSRTRRATRHLWYFRHFLGAASPYSVHHHIVSLIYSCSSILLLFYLTL